MVGDAAHEYVGLNGPNHRERDHVPIEIFRKSLFNKIRVCSEILAYDPDCWCYTHAETWRSAMHSISVSAKIPQISFFLKGLQALHLVVCVSICVPDTDGSRKAFFHV